jgi:putative membrane protein
MKKYFVFLLKGISIGIANAIPGVSGGTIALITKVFERIINSIKSFDITAIKLLFSGKLKKFLAYTDFKFLMTIVAGIGIAAFSLANVLAFLFEYYPVYVWAYFFGLILASVYFVGKTVKKWTTNVIIFFITGTIIAIIISMLNPTTENKNIFYIFLCGVTGITSMVLPGISGSFILILMGNYKLLVIDAVKDINLSILIPFFLGCILGILVFSHVFSWILKKFKDQTISLLTGFILGSLVVIWPWKHEKYLLDNLSNQILEKGHPIVTGYQRYIPDSFNTQVIIAIILMITGIVSIWILEKTAQDKT